MPYNLSIPGWMPESELKTLERLARLVPPGGQMLEVGPFVGRSTWCWAHSVDPSVTVHCLDIWDPAAHPYHPPSTIGQPGAINAEFGVAEHVEHCVGSFENFKRNVGDCPNIRVGRGASPYDFTGWREPLDLVFLDGVHHNPGFWDDLTFWFWKLKPGGIACGDDCARTHPDVLWGVHDFAKNHGLTFFVKGRIWIMPRPPVDADRLAGIWKEGVAEQPFADATTTTTRPDSDSGAPSFVGAFGELTPMPGRPRNG